MFVIETLFVSKEITEYRFYGLLETSHKFNIKLNVLKFLNQAVMTLKNTVTR